MSAEAVYWTVLAVGYITGIAGLVWAEFDKARSRREWADLTAGAGLHLMRRNAR